MSVTEVRRSEGGEFDAVLEKCPSVRSLFEANTTWQIVGGIRMARYSWIRSQLPKLLIQKDGKTPTDKRKLSNFVYNQLGPYIKRHPDLLHVDEEGLTRIPETELRRLLEHWLSFEQNKNVIYKLDPSPAIIESRKRTSVISLEEDGANGARDFGRDRLTRGDSLVGQYLREAATHKLLTMAEERELAELMRRGREARQSLQSGTCVTADGRITLEETIAAGFKARSDLVKHNLRLVISVAKKYSNTGIPLLDLIQEGNVGLMRAAAKFNPNFDTRFSTLATWWIRQAITRLVADFGRTVRLPVHFGSDVAKMLSVRAVFEQENGRMPNNGELAEMLNINLGRLAFLQDRSRLVISLDGPLDSDEPDSYTLIDNEEGSGPDPAEVAIRNNMNEKIRLALESIPPRLARVIILRYGLNGEPCTLKKVGEKMGVTRERAGQLEAEAMEALRAADAIDLLTDLL